MSIVRFVMDATVVPPLRVLIVEDNRDASDLLATLLSFDGHETYTVSDGLAAVDAAATLQPDVIFMDIGLPDLNGYEAARRIRAGRTDNTPAFVAVTGWAHEDGRRRSESAGFQAHLVKPVLNRVLQLVLLALQQRGSTP